MNMNSGSLQKTITLRQAIALYVSSVLGSGVLVLPGLAAQIAGPSSLIAWIILSLASYPFAFTFGSLSARKPEFSLIFSAGIPPFVGKLAAAGIVVGLAGLLYSWLW